MERDFINPNSIFKINITVQPQDIDDLNHVNNVIYLRYVQDVASAHWNAIAPDGFKEKFSWVVLRHEIDYKSAAVLGDEIIAETWVGMCEGPRSERHVELYHATTMKMLVKAKTTWCLLDAKTLKPKRIEQDIVDLFSSSI
jgi:acyl-CoA thioester hydrolase